MQTQQDKLSAVYMQLYFDSRISIVNDLLDKLNNLRNVFTNSSQYVWRKHLHVCLCVHIWREGDSN